ncbi:MAG: HNH endonuclease [Kiritimatiellae bacterium]|nr:HNH endonuclease [Kiritimatiellia bacterium]
MSTLLRKYIPIHSAQGEKWRSRTTIKTHLKQDFHGRCAYCDDSDSLVDIDFHIEHFAPKTKFPERKYLYQNLLYACPYCNESKSEYWVSDDPDINIKDGEGIVNPCCKDYDSHLGRRKNGCIYPKTGLGEFMYKRLKLYLARHELFFQIERLQRKIDELQGTAAGDEILPIYKKFREYYELSAKIKWKKGSVIGRIDAKDGCEKNVAKSDEKKRGRKNAALDSLPKKEQIKRITKKVERSQDAHGRR